MSVIGSFLGIPLALEYAPDGSNDEDTINRSLALFARKNYAIMDPSGQIAVKGMASVRGDRSLFAKRLNQRFVSTCLRFASKGGNKRLGEQFAVALANDVFPHRQGSPKGR